MENPTAPNNAADNQGQALKQPFFGIEKLYVADLSVEVPQAPAIFLEHGQPEVGIQMESKAKRLDESAFDVALTITVNAKLGEKTLFVIEITQCGIFRIANMPEQELEPLLAIACPNLLYPYAREAVSDATLRAGFAPVLLAPVSFESLYRERQQQLAAQAQGAANQPAA
jgi:preprotein translocase subunit SecB